MYLKDAGVVCLTLYHTAAVGSCTHNLVRLYHYFNNQSLKGRVRSASLTVQHRGIHLALEYQIGPKAVW